MTLRLTSNSDAGVEYRAEWETVGATALGSVCIAGSTGTVSIELTEGELDPWLRSFCEQVVRGVWRARQRDGGAWPRRITRWRDQPAAS